VKWSGVIHLEAESMLAEVHTEITNMANQGDEFQRETENK
jgi:hypothetical protein